MFQTEQIIEQTRKWIRDVVIECNFCPFAAQVFIKDTIHFQVEDSSGLDKCLEAILSECKRLDFAKEIETTLLILPNGHQDFDDYLELVDYAERLLEQQGYEGIYQIATFHPFYCFHGSEKNDPANFTNRSPYPILQLLREESIEKALEKYPHPEKIPERNIQFAREKGITYMQALLNSAFGDALP